MSLTEEEKFQLSQDNLAKDLVSRVFPDTRIVVGPAHSINVIVEDKGKVALLRSYRQIDVDSEDLLDDAIKLAEKCEQNYKEEFTVKKTYQ